MLNLFLSIKHLFIIYLFLAKEFIRALLNSDPSKRPTAEEALKHKWIVGNVAKDVDLLEDFIENFNARKTFRKAVKLVQAANQLRSSQRFSTDLGEGANKTETNKTDKTETDKTETNKAETNKAETDNKVETDKTETDKTENGESSELKKRELHAVI